jgi:hypothetical protein
MAAKKEVETREENTDPPSEARLKFLAGEISWHAYVQLENNPPEPPVIP